MMIYKVNAFVEDDTDEEDCLMVSMLSNQESSLIFCSPSVDSWEL